MKRQRKASAKPKPAAYRKKPKVVVAAAVEMRTPEAAEGRVPTPEEVAEWNSLWSGIDEEMSWAASWCPFWEMVEGSSDAYEALYEDVLWDFDIWGLKTIAGPPNP